LPSNQWLEVGDKVFHRRYNPADVSVGVVLGPTGATVIDTRNNPEEAQEIIRDVAELSALPIVAVVNTHAHYDHTFGNQVFQDAGIPIYGHHLIPTHFQEYEQPLLKQAQKQPQSERDRGWHYVILTPPSRPIKTASKVVLGSRILELLPLGPGHTETDLAVLVPDAGVWFLGDIIEESGPPMFGEGSKPQGWAAVLASLLELIKPGHTVIPGHGEPVDSDFVLRQQGHLEQLAQEIGQAHADKKSLENFRFSSDLRVLWPEEFLREAAQDGYRQLGG